MTARPTDDPLKALEARIDTIRDGRKPKPVAPGGKFAGAGFGWRMTIDLITGISVGAAMGWGLDALFGTLPLFLIIMVLFGFAAGVRVMLYSAADFQKNQAGGIAPAEEGKEHGNGR